MRACQCEGRRGVEQFRELGGERERERGVRRPEIRGEKRNKEWNKSSEKELNGPHSLRIHLESAKDVYM